MAIFEKLFVKRGTEITGKIDRDLVTDPTNIRFHEHNRNSQYNQRYQQMA